MNWINKYNNLHYCKWPKNNRVSSKMIMKRVKPGNKWISHPVNVLETFGNIMIIDSYPIFFLIFYCLGYF